MTLNEQMDVLNYDGVVILLREDVDSAFELAMCSYSRLKECIDKKYLSYKVTRVEPCVDFYEIGNYEETIVIWVKKSD